METIAENIEKVEEVKITKSKTTKKATPKTSAKPAVKTIKSVAVETPKVEEKKAETPKVEAPKAEKSTISQIIETGNATRKIVTKAGGKILGSSIGTTKTIAGIYKKAGKKAIELGKELIADTTKVISKNQKTVRDTSLQAFKETVETIKESHLIENPLKTINKRAKKK